MFSGRSSYWGTHPPWGHQARGRPYVMQQAQRWPSSPWTWEIVGSHRKNWACLLRGPIRTIWVESLGAEPIRMRPPAGPRLVSTCGAEMALVMAALQAGSSARCPGVPWVQRVGLAAMPLPSATSLLCLSLHRYYPTPCTEKRRRSRHVELCLFEAITFHANA